MLWHLLGSGAAYCYSVVVCVAPYTVYDTGSETRSMMVKYRLKSLSLYPPS